MRGLRIIGCLYLHIQVEGFEERNGNRREVADSVIFFYDFYG